MAGTERIKIQKNSEVKFIYENELEIYIAMGWEKVKSYGFNAQPTFNKIK